ncbi:helix-turn-helix transcriptional regulator [Aliivibrio salmonicida]|uniref:helix-turn-helix transcriptional regulator n=1 Tax=Aliivibrio salmonicida TaxID=40269 RepID=UPI003D13EE85
MPIAFANFLKKIRIEKKITQQYLLDLLIKSDNMFNKLDLTTLSRWERGTTTPKLEKQLFIARLLDANIVDLIDPDTYVSKIKQETLDKVKCRTSNPYLSGEHKIKLTKLYSLKGEPTLCKKLINFHTSYLNISINKEVFEKDNICINAFSNLKKEFIAHYLYGYVPINTSLKQLEPNNLEQCPFIKLSSIDDEKVMLNIISAYSSISMPRIIMSLMSLRKLRHNVNIQGLVINIQYQDVFNFFDTNTTCEVINKGDMVESGGVKVYNQRYKYIQILINIESILASSIVSSYIHNLDDYIESLLIE